MVFGVLVKYFIGVIVGVIYCWCAVRCYVVFWFICVLCVCFLLSFTLDTHNCK